MTGVLFGEMDNRTVHSSREYNNEGGRATTNYTFAGEIICDALFWNPVPGAVDWYTSMRKQEGMVMIRLKQILMTCVMMMKISEENMLPNKCNKKEAANQGTMKIDDEDTREISKEVYIRDKFDKEFDIGLISECEEDGSNSEEEEESSGEDSD